MTDQTPIERADEAIGELMNASHLYWSDLARAAFKSIDTEELADVIEAYKSRGTDSAGLAQIVKNHLTGKENQ